MDCFEDEGGGVVWAGSAAGAVHAVRAAVAGRYGNRDLSMEGMRAARKPIEQRLSNARKQLDQGFSLVG